MCSDFPGFRPDRSGGRAGSRRDCGHSGRETDGLSVHRGVDRHDQAGRGVVLVDDLGKARGRARGEVSITAVACRDGVITELERADRRAGGTAARQGDAEPNLEPSMLNCTVPVGVPEPGAGRLP